jgi:hypothetical protein
VTVLGISMDAPADSRRFAADYGIAFPLLSDEDGAVARRYVGVSSDRVALPGVTIIDRGGRIAFRQVASTKDDRMSAAELLATLDRTLGTSGPGVAPPGYAAIDRAQLRVALGGGGVRTSGDTLGTVAGSVAGLVPLGHHLLVGPWLGIEPRRSPLDLDAALVVRLPFWSQTGAVELGAVGGWTPWRDAGGNAAAHLGAWFALSPRWAVQLDAAIAEHGLGGGARSTAVTGSLGVSRLLRAPW